MKVQRAEPSESGLARGTRLAALPIRNEVADALDAPAFDPATVATLAHRAHISDALEALAAEIPNSDGRLLVAMQAPTVERTQLLRLAAATGAYVLRTTAAPADMRAHLEAKATPEARLALILFGDPIAWSSASRPERAATLLHAICEARRAGAVP